MNPFFSDHTSYGAVLAMIIPAFFILFFNKNQKLFIRLASIFLFILFFVAFILSYSRAAWISLIFAFIVFIILLLKIHFSVVVLIAAILTLLTYSQKEEIIAMIEKNKQESSVDIATHIQSIANITTDYSNLERLNRWSCAWRMFKEKPLFGWGPGTYMFQYAPFQLTEQKTPISTNLSDLGNAHSEYLGPLSESGIIGMLSFFFIVIFTIITGIRIITKTKSKEIKIIAMSLFLGLITYYIHGFLNNFLDTDKASALFWGFTAILVNLDLLIKEKSE